MSFIPKPDEAHSTSTAQDIAPALRDELKLLDWSRAHLLARLGNHPESRLSKEALAEFKKLTRLIHQIHEQMERCLSLIPKPWNGDGAENI